MLKLGLIVGVAALAVASPTMGRTRLPWFARTATDLDTATAHYVTVAYQGFVPRTPEQRQSFYAKQKQILIACRTELSWDAFLDCVDRRTSVTNFGGGVIVRTMNIKPREPQEAAE